MAAHQFRSDPLRAQGTRNAARPPARANCIPATPAESTHDIGLKRQMIRCSSDSQLRPEVLTRKFSDTIVQMPECLHKELNSHFPLRSRRSDTNANNLNLQRIAVLFISRALRDKDCLISYNQGLLEEITNSRQRTSLVRFFNNPERFKTVKQFVPDRNCKGRQFVGVALERLQVYRHNGVRGCFANDWMDLWRFSACGIL